jgi:hypothetical protein
LGDKGIKQARTFSWDETARQTLEIYREILKDGKRLL